MHCPQNDGELVAHTTHGENNLTVSYSTCPTCHGHWMDSFAANFITLSGTDDQLPQDATIPAALSCPVCEVHLEKANGENIPDTVTAYWCPHGHGYFFPAGQLAAFKSAQKAKIDYHKLWHIPLPNTASVLLGGLVVLILTGGFLATYMALQQKQVTTSQAQLILVGQKSYISGTSVLISATTSVDATLTLALPSLYATGQPMPSTDKRTHLILVPEVPPGHYTYYFTINVAGVETVSETFEFTMPQ
jgi:Zn-finger nucleic acid-binding protein